MQPYFKLVLVQSLLLKYANLVITKRQIARIKGRVLHYWHWWLPAPIELNVNTHPAPVTYWQQSGQVNYNGYNQEHVYAAAPGLPNLLSTCIVTACLVQWQHAETRRSNVPTHLVSSVHPRTMMLQHFKLTDKWCIIIHHDSHVHR